MNVNKEGLDFETMKGKALEQLRNGDSLYGKDGFYIGYGPAETDLSGSEQYQEKMDYAIGQLGDDGTETRHLVSR